VTQRQAGPGEFPSVFVSYRRRDDDESSDRPGQVSAFRQRLEGAIRRKVSVESDELIVFLDKDPARLIGTQPWQDKLRGLLARTSVFVSIMTANYLASGAEHACRWELSVFRDLCERPGDLPRTILTLQLCRPEVAERAFGSDEWGFLQSQEILGYDRCNAAWIRGPESPEWGVLVDYVADAIVEFVEKPFVAVGPVRLTSEPRAGHPVTWRLVGVGAVPSVVRTSTSWLVDGEAASGNVDGSFTPTPAHIGRRLSATVIFAQADHHPVVRVTPSVVVRGDVPSQRTTADQPGPVGKARFTAAGPGETPGDLARSVADGATSAEAPSRAADGAPAQPSHMPSSALDPRMPSSDSRDGHDQSADPVATPDLAGDAVGSEDDAAHDRRLILGGVRVRRRRAGSREAVLRPQSDRLVLTAGPKSGGRAFGTLGLIVVVALWGWSMASVRGSLWWMIGCVGFLVIAGLWVFVLDDAWDLHPLAMAATVLVTLAGGALLMINRGIPLWPGSGWRGPGLTRWTWSVCLLAAVLWAYQVLAIGLDRQRARHARTHPWGDCRQ